MKNGGTKELHPGHWVISPKEGEKKKTTFINDVLKALGFSGAVVVEHRYRRDGEQDGNITGRYGPDVVVHDSYHYHVATSVSFVRREVLERVREKYGVVIRSFGRRPAEKLFRYLLSHCDISGARHLYRYWGTWRTGVRWDGAASVSVEMVEIQEPAARIRAGRREDHRGLPIGMGEGPRKTDLHKGYTWITVRFRKEYRVGVPSPPKVAINLK